MFFASTPEKGLVFADFGGFRLWKNLWRMWKTPVNKAVEGTIILCLCKPRFCRFGEIR